MKNNCWGAIITNSRCVKWHWSVPFNVPSLLSSFREYKNKHSSDDLNAHTYFSRNILWPSAWNSPTLGVFKNIALRTEENAIHIQVPIRSEASETFSNGLAEWVVQRCCSSHALLACKPPILHGTMRRKWLWGLKSQPSSLPWPPSQWSTERFPTLKGFLGAVGN